MRITLLQAPLGRPEPLVYPLGIATLAGTIPVCHDIQLLDPNHIGLENTEKNIRNFRPDVIGLSIRNLDSQIRRDLFYYYLFLKTHIRNLRKWDPNATIIAGGSGFSLFPERIMQDNAELNLGVFLEADEIFPALLEKLDNPGLVKGVYFRKGTKIQYSGNPVLPEPEFFGQPRYDLLDPRPYQLNGGVGVQTKRGCPLKCVYCTYPHLNGKCLRSLPIESVLQELEILSNDYGIQEITFVDGVFNIPRSRTVNLLESLREKDFKIKWRGWFTEKGFDRQFAELCRDTGCPEFSFSPDGYSKETLK
ncbi:cobalamin-dependent protein, partial [bacterium]|nr:cobalamin-dependent protein [bacterium]